MNIVCFLHSSKWRKNGLLLLKVDFDIFEYYFCWFKKGKPIELAIIGLTPSDSSTLWHSKGRNNLNMKYGQLNLIHLCMWQVTSRSKAYCDKFPTENPFNASKNVCIEFCTSIALATTHSNEWREEKNEEIFMRMIICYYVFTPVDPTLHSNTKFECRWIKIEIEFHSCHATSKHFYRSPHSMAFHNQVPLWCKRNKYSMANGSKPMKSKEVTQSS